MDKHAGSVPDSLEELLKFKGVGRKTANLVVTLGFNKPGICVDTHVHRICNRWGYVQTRTPDETESRLREILPPQYWLRINDLLVTYGQNLCTPVSPFCSKCTLSPFCRRNNVIKNR
jgi:endonuclease-3